MIQIITSHRNLSNVCVHHLSLRLFICTRLCTVIRCGHNHYISSAIPHKKTFVIYSPCPGYFAEHIADNKDVKDNATVPLRSESKGVNLHNLSYAGPIVMGFGGNILSIYFQNIFIVV